MSKEEKSTKNTKKTSEKVSKDTKKEEKNTYIEGIKNEFYSDLEMALDNAEGRLIGCFWNNPQLFDDTDLKYEDFFHNVWGTLFFIGYDLRVNEGLNKFIGAEQALDAYFLKHDKCKAVWDNNGEDALKQVLAIAECMDIENYDYYLQDFKKMNVLLKMVNHKLAVVTKEDLHRYYGMTTDDIYSEYEAKLNNIFANVDMQTQSYNITYNIEKHIEEWDEGSIMGMELYGLPNFSQEIGGIPSDGVSLVGGVSNAGKSSLVRNTVFPQLIPTEEEIKTFGDLAYYDKGVFFLNEEDIQKWQREMIIWIINNRLNNVMTKNVLRNGGFLKKEEQRTLIMEAVQWMKDNIPTNHILLVPLLKFSTKHTIKLIKKYCALGYKNFIIDTFKMDNTDDAKVDNNTRLQLVQNMNHLYNVAKKESKNVRVICTVQLAKSYMLQRYLSQESLAESKNIIDVCGFAIFMRRVWNDELIEGSPHQIHVYQYGTMTEVPLYPDKNYIILFCSKTREGSSDSQCVAEVDWGRNTLKEIGWTQISPE